MPIDLICLDADDTLWHNMRFFHETQDALVAMVGGIELDRDARGERRCNVQPREASRRPGWGSRHAAA